MTFSLLDCLQRWPHARGNERGDNLRNLRILRRMTFVQTLVYPRRMPEETAKPEQPLRTHLTPWTQRGYRLKFERWTHVLAVACESETMNLGEGTKSTFTLVRIVLITGNTRGESERLLLHCLSFFQDQELLNTAIEVFRREVGELKEGGAVPQPSGALN